MSRSPQTGGRENIARIFYGNLVSPPELVLEIVSNTVDEEDGQKKCTYAQIRINDYVLYDPPRQVMSDVLTHCIFYLVQVTKPDRQRAQRLMAI